MVRTGRSDSVDLALNYIAWVVYWNHKGIQTQNTPIDHNSHNAHVPYPTIHHFGTEMYTFLFQSGVLWDMGQDIMGFVQLVYTGGKT